MNQLQPPTSKHPGWGLRACATGDRLKPPGETNGFQAMRSPSVIIGSFGRQFFLAFYGWDVFFGVSWKVKKFDEDGRS